MMNTYERSEIFGRRTRFALIVDLLLYCAILWTAVDFLLRQSPFAAPVATLWTAAAAIVICLLLQRRASQGKKRLRERVKTDLLLERLLLMDRAEAGALFRPDAVLQNTSVSRDDLLGVLQTGARAVWLCGDPDADAKELLRRYSDRIRVIPKEQTAARISDTVSDGVVQQELIRRGERRRKRPTLRALLKQWKPNRFTLLGIVLMGLSFLTSYRILFRLAASACFVIGSMLYTRSIALSAVDQSR